jgi:hypothetical protein
MKEEPSYCLTYTTERVLVECYNFDNFSIRVNKKHGNLKPGDLISIDLLLRMYEEQYELVHKQEVSNE